jgi:hypothetical protein
MYEKVTPTLTRGAKCIWFVKEFHVNLSDLKSWYTFQIKTFNIIQIKMTFNAIKIQVSTATLLQLLLFFFQISTKSCYQAFKNI